MKQFVDALVSDKEDSKPSKYTKALVLLLKSFAGLIKDSAP